MKITYFLGAGASANCLPIINEINSRLEYFKSNLSDPNVTKLFGNHQPTLNNIQRPKTEIQELCDEIDWLITECKRHKTVDTVAKKFYLQKHRHRDLIRLKRVLSVFFVFEQTFKKPSKIRNNQAKESPDKRYDSFIASIIGKEIGNLDLPSNLNIITWNYDLQFELAFKEYRHDATIADIQLGIQAVPSRVQSFANADYNPHLFSLIRLNGIAGLGGIKNGEYMTRKTVPDSLLDAENDSDYWHILINYYFEMKNSMDDYLVHESSLFNYSWEDSEVFKDNVYPTFKDTRRKAINIFNKTDILVIIGYSFPFFNREVDMDLFQALDIQKIKKIYVQDPNFGNIKQKILSYVRAKNPEFEGFLSNRFVEISYLDQFVIPDEF